MNDLGFQYTAFVRFILCFTSDRDNRYDFAKLEREMGKLRQISSVKPSGFLCNVMSLE